MVTPSVADVLSHTFYTDVIAGDAHFTSAKRIDDLGLLEPATRNAVNAIIVDAAKRGITLIAFETYRSEARQESLFRDGSTQLRRVGVHHYGLACDIVRVSAGEPTWKGDYSFLGHLAYAHKLIWGGDWGRPDIKHDFVDVVHVQRCSIARQPSLFAGEWYPDADYDPYADRTQVISV